MNEFATSIGWLVIIFFIIYVVGSLVESINKQKSRKNEDRMNIKFTAYKIAARRIYQQTTDSEIREKVKSYANIYLNGWAMLDLDLSNEEFRSKYSELKTYEAEEQIKKLGYPLSLEEGKLKTRW